MKKSTKKHNKYLRHPEDSVFEDGYGQIPKRVMQDSRLSIEAKAIYGYLSSFAGGGNTAFPAVVKICRDLKISKDRYYRHISYIVEAGYITIDKAKTQEEGKFPVNTYTFNYSVPRKRNDLIEVFKNGGWTATSLLALKKGDRYRMWDKDGKRVTDRITGANEFIADEDFLDSLKNAYKK